MRFRYLGLLAFILGFTGAVSAQIHLAPNTDNAALRQYAQEEISQLGIPEQGPVRTNENCPPEFFGTFFVLKGDTLTIPVDTTALGGGTAVTLALVDCEPVDFGTVTLEGDQLVYVANPDVDGGLDTICVDFCKPALPCQTFKYPIIVKRAGQVISPAPVVLQGEEFLNEYCLDDSGFPGELVCNYFDDCLDSYDGEGQQGYYFTQYSQPANCFRYKASRFAGDDLVCVVLCDEFAVCDTFRVTFRIQSDTLGLPFFDDFSYNGPFPASAYWLDRHAFVNNTMAKSPPSVGMATLDGLSSNGQPYGNLGSADRLTSKYIDLGSPSGSVYLKFYVTPKGYGLYPNEPDSLLLEFRKPDGQWQQVANFGGLIDDIPVDSVPPFVFQSIQVDDEYFYKGFQFRFRNFVSPVGIYDLWHIDYIFLNDQEGPGDTFDDIAFTQLPPSFLKNYTSMPWWHFEGFVEEELRSEPLESGFFNHFAETITIADSDILLSEAITGTIFPGSDNVVDGPDANIPSKDPVTRSKALQPSTLAGYKAQLQSGFPGAEEVDLLMEYRLTVNSQQALFFRNDTVRRHNRFEDYFAYDDGTAESFIFFANPQAVSPTLAVKFHANVADTLRGVQFHFPHVNGDAENQLFNLKVWLGDYNSEPVYEYIFKTPLYADSKFDTLQGFTTYKLKDILGELTPVGLPAGSDFYIGFQQVTITNYGIPIGFDVNNEAQQNLFYDLGTGFEPFPAALRGAPLLRAIVGSETPIDTRVEEQPNRAAAIRLFPNPSTGWVQVEGGAQAAFGLYNTMGQLLLRGSLQDGRLDMGGLPNGLYILNIRTEEGINWTGKITLAR
ncbi:MAG: T9SS type A sorting domain-containing protein [Saprospirales bacterium]|nr:T9SS type A sorting domain-containing protein [Saprospirales bacterium]